MPSSTYWALRTGPPGGERPRGPRRLAPLRLLPAAGLAAVLVGGCGAPPSPVPATTASPGPPAPSHAARPDSVREGEVAPGVRHATRWHSGAPWVVHVVEVDPRACGVEVRAVKAADRLVGREATSSMARRLGASLGRPVLAAVNADFFAFEPPGVPEGPQVVAGEVVKGAGTHRAAVEGGRLDERPVFAVTADGRGVVGRTRLVGTLRVPGHAGTLPTLANAPPGARLSLYDRWIGLATPADAGVVEAVLRRVGSPTAAGDTIRGVVLRIDTAAAGVSLGAGEVVLAGRGREADVLARLSPGDTVAWWFAFQGLPRRIAELVGGFPLLLLDGAPVHEVEGIRAAFAESRHPRTAVGLLEDGRIAFVVLDGRQPGHSAGMSLAELAAYVLGLGVRDALNLDGGGSTTLVVEDSVVNRPSDAGGEREVANALVVLGPAPGAC